MDNQTTDYLKQYQWEINFPLADGMSCGLQEKRHRLNNLMLTAEQQVHLRKMDANVISYVTELDDIDDAVITDKASQPLANWWWHLRKIRAKSYPTDLLPTHLQAVYGNGGAVAA